MSVEPLVKPLGRKTYGSIGHLPCSRMGHGDHAVHLWQANICTENVRDKYDRIIVQEKLDGSCCSVAMIGGQLHALGRAGWPAVSSKYIQHRMFHDWVMDHSSTFFAVLKEGERLVGEWLAQAHSTRYELWHQPFVVFDIMREDQRLPFDEVRNRIFFTDMCQMPILLSDGPPRSVADMLAMAQGSNHHRAVDPIEGVVYRVERKSEPDFLAKYVRPDKKDGIYLPEISGSGEPVWNWKPHNWEKT